MNVNEMFFKLVNGKVNFLTVEETVCSSVSRITTFVPEDNFHFKVTIVTTIDNITDSKEIIADRGLTLCLLKLAADVAKSINY